MTRDPRHELSDSRPAAWLISFIFGFVGFAFVGLSIQEAARGKLGLAVAGAMAAGFIGIIVALHAATQAERLTLRVDRLRRKVHVTGRLPWRRRETSWRRGEVAGAELEQDTDSDGDPVWRTVLVLGDGGRIPLMACWRHDKAACERHLERARTLLAS